MTFKKITELKVRDFDQEQRTFAFSHYRELEKIASGIDDLHERLKFWSYEQKAYRINVRGNPQLFASSGVYKTVYNDDKIWLDGLIQCAIDDLENQIRNLPKEPIIIEPTITPQQAQQVAYLHELGVLEFLKKRLKTESISTISHFVAAITGVPQPSIKTPLNRIKDGGISSVHFEQVRQYARQKKIELRPLKEIKFDNEVE
jgi:hypothetical protein